MSNKSFRYVWPFSLRERALKVNYETHKRRHKKAACVLQFLHVHFVVIHRILKLVWIVSALVEKIGEKVLVQQCLSYGVFSWILRVFI